MNARRRGVREFLARPEGLGRHNHRRDNVSRLVYDQEAVEIARLVFRSRHCGAVPVERPVDEGLNTLISVRKPGHELKRNLRLA